MAYTSLVPDAFPYLYESGFKLELQQMTSRLAAYTNVYPVNGESRRFNKLGKVTAVPITTRFGETNPADINLEFRSLTVGFKKVANIVDRIEAHQLGAIGGPQAQIQQSQLAAAGRDRDLTLVNGIIGDAYEGRTGSVAVPLPGDQTIPVNFVKSGNPTNTGMTFDKLLRIKELAGMNNIAGQNVEGQSAITVIMTHEELGDLLTQEKLTNNFYVERKPLAGGGEIWNFLNMTLVCVDPSILPYNAGTDIRTCVAFARECVAFGYAMNPFTRVDELPEHNYNIQLFCQWGWGATRLYDEGVWLVPCDRSPA